MVKYSRYFIKGGGYCAEGDKPEIKTVLFGKNHGK